jgi:hypothetical protein
MRRLRRSKKSLTIKTHRRAGRAGDMPDKPVRLHDVDGDRRSAATDNTRGAAEGEKDALYHAEMADSLSAVGHNQRARSERSRATILRRAAQIKRDLATKYDPQGRE